VRTQPRHISVPGITPLVDVVFLLIVFFVLVSRVVDLERVRMDLPAPNPAATLPRGGHSAAVVNVVPGEDGMATGYRLNGSIYTADAAGEASLGAALVAELQADPATAVLVRADRDARSAMVLPVLHAARRAAAQVGLPHPVRVELAVEVPR